MLPATVSRPTLVAAVMATLAAGLAAGGDRGPCDPRPKRGEVGTVCGFRSPEDVEVVAAAGVMLVSQMAPLFGGGRGSLAAVTLESLSDDRAEVWTIWPPADGSAPMRAAGAVPPAVGDPSCRTPPAAGAFAPHGIASVALADGGVTRVAVVSHAPREAVELFDLRGTGRAATLAWRGCVPLPQRAAANDLAVRADGTLVAANCVPTFAGVRGALWMLAASFGMNTGDVLAWSPAGGWRQVAGTEARGANGIAIGAGGMPIWFTETGAGRVGRVDGSTGATTHAPIEGAPDNLSWTSRGTLVTATHLSTTAFLACALGRRPCLAPWALVEIEPHTLATTVLLRHDGSAVGAVTGAAEHGGRYYLGAVFDDRLGVWAPPAGAGAATPPE